VEINNELEARYIRYGNGIVDEEGKAQGEMKHIHDDLDNFLRRSSIYDEGMVDRMGHELDNLGFGESRERWIEEVDKMGCRFGESRERWREWVMGLDGGYMVERR
jgi:hypothetical protein